MSEGTMTDTGPAETPARNAGRLVGALCDEFGPGLVAGLAVDQVSAASAAASGASRELTGAEWAGAGYGAGPAAAAVAAGDLSLLEGP